jgi:hypothetical protein
VTGNEKALDMTDARLTAVVLKHEFATELGLTAWVLGHLDSGLRDPQISQ